MNNVIECSLVIPIYKSEKNIPSLIAVLTDFSSRFNNSFEVVFVVDGSPDNSLEALLSSETSACFTFKIIEFSRNFGAFTAVRTGLERSSGKYIAVMAADLQEPLDLIAQMYEALRTETTDIALGQRVSRKDTLRTKTFANLYWAMYRKFVLADIPKGGIDVFACNRKVINTLLTIEEPNSSLIAQLFWVGYRRTFIPYERKARQIGTSSWSFKKKLKYMLDSIFSYSDGPLMLIFWAGLISFGLSSVIGFATLLGKLMGWISVPGYTALTLLILFFGSTIIFTQGIIGCYLWRAFENTKRRPLSIVKSEYSFNEIEK